MTALGTVVVGGGTGFIGKHLCNLLKNKGYAVTVVSRMPGPQRISWTDLKSGGLPRGTTAVINLAGQNVMDFKQRWTPGFKQNVYNSRINSTKALAEAIDEASTKPSVYVAISGVGIYKPDASTVYTEDTPCSECFDFFSKLCMDWEKAAELSPQSKNCRVLNIRSGVVLGRSGGMIKQMYLPFYFGLGGPVGNGDQYLPWIHIKDLSNLITFVMEKSTVSGVLNGVAPKPATNKEFTAAFAKALNRPAIFAVPNFVLNMLLSEERADMITKGQKVLPARTETIGYKFAYPDINSACQEIVNAKTN